MPWTIARPIALLAGVLLLGGPANAFGQPAQERPRAESLREADTAIERPAAVDAAEAERWADEALEAPGLAADDADATTAPSPRTAQLNALDLYFQGGILMIPITIMSLVVVACSLERAIGLRRGKVIPRRLERQLRELLRAPGGLDPRAAYRLCQHDRSATAYVLRAALLKAGRPASEIEHAAAEASEREAARLYANVRPIYLSVTITPLLGLLGTVQGMIQAFFVTAESAVGVNKAQSLAAGIYVALVTTFAGLTVAIPAAIIAHYFEGRIQRLFRDIDELIQELLPQFERFEGKFRASRNESGYVLAPVSAGSPNNTGSPGNTGDMPPRAATEPPPFPAGGEPPRRTSTSSKA